MHRLAKLNYVRDSGIDEMVLITPDSFDSSRIFLDRPVKTKKGDGKFYSVYATNDKNQKSPIYLTTDSCPLTTYGVNKWGSMFLYVDELGQEPGVNDFMNLITKLENDIKGKLLSETSTKLSSRIKPSRTSGVLRLSIKPIYRKDNTLASDIKNIEEEQLTLTKLKEGHKYDIYPVIKIDSIFVSKQLGVIVQLKLHEAFMYPNKADDAPKINIIAIRKRYENCHLFRAISFKTEDKEFE